MNTVSTVREHIGTVDRLPVCPVCHDTGWFSWDEESAAKGFECNCDCAMGQMFVETEDRFN